MLQWISEKHRCQHCGKIMTKKYGSGIFCSITCAHSRLHTEETKNKIRHSLEITRNLRRNQIRDEYENSPKYCKICGKTIPFNRRHREYCCTKCGKIAGSLASSKIKKDQFLKGELKGCAGHNVKHYIEYKNVKLDSTYELLLAKDLDMNNIKWEKCTQALSYVTPSKETHGYIPDFYLPDYDIYLDPKNDFLINNINP